MVIIDVIYSFEPSLNGDSKLNILDMLRTTSVVAHLLTVIRIGSSWCCAVGPPASQWLARRISRPLRLEVQTATPTKPLSFGRTVPCCAKIWAKRTSVIGGWGRQWKTSMKLDLKSTRNNGRINRIYRDNPKWRNESTTTTKQLLVDDHAPTTKRNRTESMGYIINPVF